MPISSLGQSNGDHQDAISYLESENQANSQRSDYYLEEEDIVDWKPEGEGQKQQTKKAFQDHMPLAEEESDGQEEITSTAEPENSSSEQESKGRLEIEQTYGSLTDAQIFQRVFGSKATFSGSYSNGEFYSLENEGEKGDGDGDGDDGDEKSTLLHGYINSIAIIGPPKARQQQQKEKKTTWERENEQRRHKFYINTILYKSTHVVLCYIVVVVAVDVGGGWCFGLLWHDSCQLINICFCTVVLFTDLSLIFFKNFILK